MFFLKSHQISALRPHSLSLCSLKTWVLTSAAQREGQVTAGEIYVAHAQSLFNLPCLRSECISGNIHGLLASTKYDLASYLKQV